MECCYERRWFSLTKKLLFVTLTHWFRPHFSASLKACVPFTKSYPVCETLLILPMDHCVNRVFQIVSKKLCTITIKLRNTCAAILGPLNYTELAWAFFFIMSGYDSKVHGLVQLVIAHRTLCIHFDMALYTSCNACRHSLLQMYLPIIVGFSCHCIDCVSAKT